MHLARERQHLALAVGQRIRLAERLGRQLRVDDALALMHAAHGVRELARRTVFQQVALRTRIQRAAQVARPREGGHDDDLRASIDP